MGNPIAELGLNIKTNFTEAIASGARPEDCLDKVLEVAGLSDAFLSQPFELPMSKALEKLPADQKQNGIVFTTLVAKLALVDKKVDPTKFDKAKTFKDVVDIMKEMLKTGNKTAIPARMEAQSGLSTGAAVGIGIGALVVVSAIGYHMLKKD